MPPGWFHSVSKRVLATALATIIVDEPQTATLTDVFPPPAVALVEKERARRRDYIKQKGFEGIPKSKPTKAFNHQTAIMHRVTSALNNSELRASDNEYHTLRPVLAADLAAQYARDPHCRLCGVQLIVSVRRGAEDDDDEKHNDSNNLSVDRIIPGKRGGAYEIGNMQITCLGCNFAKASMAQEEAVILIARISQLIIVLDGANLAVECPCQPINEDEVPQEEITSWVNRKLKDIKYGPDRKKGSLTFDRCNKSSSSFTASHTGPCRACRAILVSRHRSHRSLPPIRSREHSRAGARVQHAALRPQDRRHHQDLLHEHSPRRSGTSRCPEEGGLGVSRQQRRTRMNNAYRFGCRFDHRVMLCEWKKFIHCSDSRRATQQEV